MHHETFERPGPFGDPIRGDIRVPDDGDPSTAVVVVHGFKGFKDWGFFPHLARELAQAGHAAVTFDFSLNGTRAGAEDLVDLEAFARNTFTRELEELRWVLRLVAQGELLAPAPHALGLLGHSRGGGTAILAAREEDDVTSLVTWASVATFDRWDDATKDRWRASGRTHTRNARTGQDLPLDRTLLEDLEANPQRLDVEAAAREVEVPWLVVHGSEDESVAESEGQLLAQVAPWGRLARVEGAGHTFGASHPFREIPPHLGCALRSTLLHFRRSLLEDSQGVRDTEAGESVEG